MSVPAFEPPSEPPPSLHPAPWRRVLALALDVLIVLIVLESWELPVIQLAGDLFYDAPPDIGATPMDVRGFSLSGRGGQIIGLGATGVALALQVPFLWRASTLGLSLFGLETRTAGRRAPPYLSLPWTIGAWGISIAGFVAIITAFFASTHLDTSANTLAIALVAVAVAAINLATAVRSGQSILDRVLGVHIAFKDAPIEVHVDHVTGWQPRPDFVPRTSGSRDEELVDWRAHASADPLAAFLDRPGPMAKAPEDPATVQSVDVDDPFAAVGNAVVTDETAEVVTRLRSRLESSEPAES